MSSFQDSWRGGGTGRGAYTLVAGTTSQVPLTLQLAAGATANGFLIENSAGTDLFSVDPSGNITIAGNITAVINETLTGNVSLTGTLSVTGATTLTGNVTTVAALTVGTNATFGGVTSAPAMHLRLRTAAPANIGNNGAIYTAVGDTDTTELFYLDAAGNTVQITDAGALEGASLFWNDDEYIRMGNTAAAPDARLGWNTAQTVDGLFLGISDGQNTFIIAENGDRAYDFAHGAQTNPTVYLQSAAQSATEFSAWNASKISFGLGIATVATDYVVGRNADGTNLLQFNVPTGASFEFSVNDVAQMTMSATAVNFQDNSLTTTGGGSLTGTWTDLGIVTTVDINGGTVDGTIIGGAVAAAGTFTAIVGTSLDLNGALDLDVAALGATITNTADTASSQVVIFEGDRATVADGDEAYLTFRLSDSGGTQDEGARITWKATTVAAGATQDTDLIFSALVNNVLTTMLTLDGSASEIVPAVAINSAAAITGTAITGTSFVIGANTLTTTEWAFLDGQDQSVFTTSNPTFGNLTITSFAANWTNAGRTVADLGIVTTVDINGGTLDGVTIGGASAAAGTFTAVVATSLDLNGALDLDVAALGATITNTADAASSQVAIFEGDRATIADGDEAYLTFRLSDSAGNQDEGARITWKATTVLSGATQDTDLIFSALVNNVLTEAMRIDGSVGGYVGINVAVAAERVHIDAGNATNTLRYSLKVANAGAGDDGANIATGLLFSVGSTANERGKGGLIYNNPTGGTWNRGDFHFLQNTVGDSATAVLADSVVTIKNSGIVIIGAAVSTAYGRLGQRFEVNTSANYGGLATNTWSATAAEAGIIDFNRSKSATIGTYTVVASGDALGRIHFRGSDGAAFQDGAAIYAEVDGTPGLSDMPGRLIFATTPDGSGNLSQRMTILNSGVVTIGSTTNTAYGTNGELLEINKSNSVGVAAFNQWSSVAGTSSLINFKRSKSDTIGTHTVVVSGDSLGILNFQGSDGTNFENAARIEAFVDGTPGNDDMPGRLVFSTTPDGSVNLSERMRITSTGTMLISDGTTVALDADLTGISGTSPGLVILRDNNSHWNQVLVGSGANAIGPTLAFFKTRSTAMDANTIVVNGDDLMSIIARGSDGAAYIVAAQIRMEVDGTPGLSDMPGRITLSTTADGANDVTERMRISSDGTVDMADRFIMNGTAKTLTDAATSLFDITLTAGSMTGGAVMWTIEASDGTDHQSLSGITTWAAVNKAGAYTTTVNNDTANDSKAVSAGTLTTVWDLLTGTNKVTLRVTPTGSLTETTYRVTYQIINNTASAITIL